jgi:hypothetical protein
MSQNDTQVNADAEDQHEGEGEDLDTNADTDTGADDSQDTGDDTAGDDNAGDEGGFKTKFEDQQKRAKNAEDLLRKAGLDPKTGKPKESRAPNKDGKALSDEDTARITRSEERSERAALRSMGITHADDIEYVRKAATRLGIDVEEAATDELVKSKLDRMKAARDTKDATPPPNKRGGQGSNKKLPDFSKMSNTEFDAWEGQPCNLALALALYANRHTYYRSGRSKLLRPTPSS